MRSTAASAISSESKHAQIIPCATFGLIGQGVILYRRVETGAALGDPSFLVFDVCSSIFAAFTAILGLVVYIKYILALLNVRALVGWAAE